jgi:hypothetical protein
VLYLGFDGGEENMGSTATRNARHQNTALDAASEDELELMQLIRQMNKEQRERLIREGLSFQALPEPCRATLSAALSSLTGSPQEAAVPRPAQVRQNQ